jgi:3-methylfumaryl-CoA hydratase
VTTGVIDPGVVEALAGVLSVPAPRETLPPMWHQVHLLDRPPQQDLGPDGHALHGIPAPPGEGRKRMFAGGRLETHRPLTIGVEATRTTSVVRTQEKTGRSGALTFVTLRSEYTQAGRLAATDEVDIVYRAEGSTVQAMPGNLADTPWPAPTEPSLTLTADETLLFRFSALTYNAHRIHYDLRWAQHEGYGGLLVHGPLQVLMVAELLRRNGIELTGHRLSYRLVAPMTGVQTFTVSAGAAGVDHGAEVHDVRGTLTAVASLEALDTVTPPSGQSSDSS